MSLQTWEEQAESRESRKAAESATVIERIVGFALVAVAIVLCVYEVVAPVVRAVAYFLR